MRAHCTRIDLYENSGNKYYKVTEPNGKRRRRFDTEYDQNP